MREPLREGVTKDMVLGASSRGERCDRNRRSSMAMGAMVGMGGRRWTAVDTEFVYSIVTA